MLIDTHCHLSSPELHAQVDAVVERAAAAGVGRIVTVATSPGEAREAVPILERHAQVYLAAGIHPHEAGRADGAMLAELAALHRDWWQQGPLAGRLVGVGETGLDFHYDFASPSRQEEVFRFQLALACEVGRPVIIHARRSEQRVCEILGEYAALRGRVVFHCFSGGPGLAERILEMGFWLSYTGLVTFRGADDVRASAQRTPADRLLVETDAPYLTPEPHRRVRPNEPAFVRYTVQRLAEVRGESVAGLAEQTARNAERFFGLPEESA